MKVVISLVLTILFVNIVASKVNYEVTNELKKQPNVNILVLLKEELNYEKFNQGKQNIDIDVKAQMIVDELMNISERSQKKLTKFLNFKKLAFKTYWVSNSVSIENVDKKTIDALSENENISEILLDKFIGEDPLEKSVVLNETLTNDKIIEPNMLWVKAEKAWKQGHKGKGIVIGLSDSGIRYQHPGVVHSYRGKKKESFDHNYNWFDPLFRSKVPIDTRDHGTHCTGSATGGRKTNRKIGVAPHAKWIHCHRTSTSSVHKCLQWLLAPTDLEDKNAQVKLRPHISSHSYGCTNCGLERGINALLNAGVHVVNAAGNSGPRCNTISEIAKFKHQLTIGALEKGKDSVARFSSLGPVPGQTKPELAAPGANIVSASGRSDSYVSKSGTSMACPTVAGAIAVLWEAVPELSRKIEETNAVLFKTSKGQSFNICGTNGSPNAAVGYGTIDVEKMIKVGKELYSN
eukprot:gene3879-7093_t